jgi:hypothetical protein
MQKAQALYSRVSLPLLGKINHNTPAVRCVISPMRAIIVDITKLRLILAPSLRPVAYTVSPATQHRCDAPTSTEKSSSYHPPYRKYNHAFLP